MKIRSIAVPIAMVLLCACSTSMGRLEAWPDVDGMTARLDNLFGCAWGRYSDGSLYCVRSEKAGEMTSEDMIIDVMFSPESSEKTDFAKFRADVGQSKVYELVFDLQRADTSKVTRFLIDSLGFEPDTARRLIATPTATAASGQFSVEHAPYHQLVVRAP